MREVAEFRIYYVAYLVIRIPQAPALNIENFTVLSIPLHKTEQYRIPYGMLHVTYFI